MQYFILRNQKQIGPFSTNEILKNLSYGDLIRTSSGVSFLSIENFPELLEIWKKGMQNSFSSKKYYYLNGLKRIGPLEYSEILAEKIHLETLLWEEKENKWKPAKYFSEFDGQLLPSPPKTPIFSLPSYLTNEFKHSLKAILVISIVFSAISSFGVLKVTSDIKEYATIEERYYYKFETGLINNLSRPFRFIVSLISDDIRVYLSKEEYNFPAVTMVINTVIITSVLLVFSCVIFVIRYFFDTRLF